MLDFLVSQEGQRWVLLTGDLFLVVGLGFVFFARRRLRGLLAQAEVINDRNKKSMDSLAAAALTFESRARRMQEAAVTERQAANRLFALDVPGGDLGAFVAAAQPILEELALAAEQRGRQGCLDDLDEAIQDARFKVLDKDGSAVPRETQAAMESFARGFAASCVQAHRRAPDAPTLQ